VIEMDKKNYTIEPIFTDDGELIGIVLTLNFDRSGKLSSSGKNVIDFSTGGNVEIDCNDGISRKMGINIYHKP